MSHGLIVSGSNHQKTVTPNADSSIVSNDCLLENDFSDNVDDDLSDNDGLLHESDQYQMKGGITLIKRQKPRIIRSVRFNKNKDPENYCREQIMLYTPWRNEKKDVLKNFNTYQDRFEHIKELIEENRKQYENHSAVVKRLKDNEFRKLVQSLNMEQKEFFYDVLNSVKIGKVPLRLFLSGGAGVGKSTVTNALYEALIRYLNSQPQNNLDDVSVVKVAPTGKAAFNIRGNTLHSAFKIPANRGFSYCTLDRDRLNTIRSQLHRMKVIFIDEVSMVGSGMFNFLDLRLQQIMGTKEPFGGLSIITVSDLFQLKPVFDH